MLRALGTVVIACTVGTIGFYVIDDFQHTLLECFFMTVITLATVGYGEVVPLGPAGQIFASILIIFGMGTLIYFGSTLIAFWVEYDVRHARRRKRMQKAIEDLSGHIIVCGAGTTGARVVSEMLKTKTPFVVVDVREEHLEAMCQVDGMWRQDILFIHGDATEDKVLEQAGITRAKGLVAALRNDKDNLYLILSARQINPRLRIVGRATEEDAPSKMLRAGADKVVAPNLLGGLRIASEMLRPDVTEFLDVMMRDTEQATRFAQVALPAGSTLAGQKLCDTKIRKATDVLVIAIRRKSGEFIYNPGSDTVLEEEAILVVLGATDSVIRLQDLLTG
jgi:voltage-gated potassium channel